METSSDDFSDCEGDELQNYSYLCFACQKTFNAVNTMMDHVSISHNIDIRNIIKSANINNDYDWIKIVNYLRKNNKSINLTDIVKCLWKDDEYLKPHILDDNLLFFDYETIFYSKEEDVKTDNESIKIKELESKITNYESTINILRNKITELLDCDDTNVEQVNNQVQVLPSKLNQEDNAYFTGYSHFSIHDIMIKDKVRTESYRKFIEENGSKYFKNKIVLDVGCGTGILSIFAARAGASHVYAVDCSDIIYDAMAIVEKNELKDKITLIHGKLEETSLPCDKVDVVISEWMGYFLIYESMLDSVLYACRKYLDPTSGMVFPRYFSLNIVGADMSAFRAKNVDCWDSVFGIDMTCMKMNVMKEVMVEVIPQEEIITDSFLLRDYDVQSMAFDSNSICPQIVNQEFQLKISRSGKMGAIVAYFDTFFMMPNASAEEQVMFSTGPAATSTHWQQTVLLLNDAMDVIEGEIITGFIHVCRHNMAKRGLMFTLTIGGKIQHFEFS